MAETMNRGVRQVTTNSRQDRAMLRADALRLEMREAVKTIGKAEHLKKFGYEGNRKDQNREASKATGLTFSVVQRLSWKRLKRIPADIADVVRECVAELQAKEDAKARHELEIFATRLQSIEAWCSTVDPDFYSGEAIPALQSLRGDSVLAGPNAASKTESGSK